MRLVSTACEERQALNLHIYIREPGISKPIYFENIVFYQIISGFYYTPREYQAVIKIII